MVGGWSCGDGDGEADYDYKCTKSCDMVTKVWNYEKELSPAKKYVSCSKHIMKIIFSKYCKVKNICFTLRS